MTFPELELVAGNTRALVAPERGCHITSLHIGTRELFYMDRATFDNPARHVRGGVPLMFPFCGRLVDDTFVPSGARIAQHGFARDHPWRVVERGAAWIRCAFEVPAEVRAVFPYNFTLDHTIWVWPGGLQAELLVHNHDTRPIPMTPGWHPYFAIAAANKPATRVDIPAYPHEKINNTGEPNFPFPMPASGRMSAELPGEGPVRIEMSANLPLLQTWTQAGADFLCLEPFGGMPNAVNQPDAPTVPPGGATRWWMRIFV